jgi:hypothetical protein
MSYLEQFTANTLAKYRTNNLLKINCNWKRFKNFCQLDEKGNVIEEKDEKTGMTYNLITENNFILFLKDSINLYKDTLTFIEKPNNDFLELFWSLNILCKNRVLAKERQLSAKIKTFNFSSSDNDSKTNENNRYFGLRLLGKMKPLQKTDGSFPFFFDTICDLCSTLGDFLPSNYGKTVKLVKDNTIINIEADEVSVEDLSVIEQLEYLMTLEMKDNVSEYVLGIIPEDRKNEFRKFYYRMSQYFWNKYVLEQDQEEKFLNKAIECLVLSGESENYVCEDFHTLLAIETKNKKIKELEKRIKGLEWRLSCF